MTHFTFISFYFCLFRLNCNRRAELGEYCLREQFKADCSGPLPTSAVTARPAAIVQGRILMRSAQYGRPHLGRCVQRHFHGFQGCAVDVLHTLDRLCSGRSQCSVDVFQTFGSLKPCSEIESFLQADFICVPGISLFTYDLFINFIC